MKVRLLLVGLLLLGACSGTPRKGDAEPPIELDGGSRGREDARKAIAEGHPRILTQGFEASDTGEMDVETGLPEENQGCLVIEGDTYVADFNAEIRRAAVAGELEGMALKRKVTNRKAIEIRFARGRPIVVKLGEPGAKSPGGAFRVGIHLSDPEDEESFSLFVSDAKTGRSRELRFLGGPNATLLFDDGGTTALVRDDEFGLYMTFDLPSGLFMQGFPDE